MFLSNLREKNPIFFEYALKCHKEGKITPNTYMLDLDTIEYNASLMLKEASCHNINLFFMTKQLGRNPLVCKKLVEIGYCGAVVVDFQEAQVMMQNNIPIAHIGHLVQPPEKMLHKIISYGVGLITVFSVEKARSINDIAQKEQKIQNIALKVYDSADFIYEGQEGGFAIDDLEFVIDELSSLNHVKITTLTSFPCFIYNDDKSVIEATHNVKTLQKAKKILKKKLGYEILLNLPSCTQTSLMKDIALMGANSAEPGSALIGMTPNNVSGNALEIPAMVYVSEISHSFKGHAYCFGGGSYPRGAISHAFVSSLGDIPQLLQVIQPSADSIDYYIELEGDAPVDSSVLMNFRTQVFVTRSTVAVVSGIRKNNPQIEGIYSSCGYLIEKGAV